MLNESVGQTSNKKRISHCKEQMKEPVSSSMGKSIENNELESVSSNRADDDDDDIPIEFKEIEQMAASMTNSQKLKLFKAKLAEVQDYLHKCRPRTIEEISYKTDKIFLSDHLLNAIETIEDELNCDRYLNVGNVINEDSDDDDALPAVCPTSVPIQTKTILKKKVSFAAEDEVKWFDEPSRLPTRKVSFASKDEVQAFEVEKSRSREVEKPSKISSTVIFDHGPVLNLTVNHSEAVFNGTSEQSDVIRSLVDIYKQFAGCTLKESEIGVPKNKVENSSEIKDQPADKDIVEAKTEVKELLDNMFGTKNANEPDPLPDNFVDSHQPKKRVSLFKQRRQMKSQ